MAQVETHIQLLAHTRLTAPPVEEFGAVTDGQAVSLTAIRTCYSATPPQDIIAAEGHKYFATAATDGQGGTDADRLIRHIVKSGHTSTLEHLSYTFAISGISRSCLAQLTRHRHFSFSVQSQRYVKMGSGDKSGGFDYVMPPSIAIDDDAAYLYTEFMEACQSHYDLLRSFGIPAEDARFVLPNAASTNLVLTGNLRSLLDFYQKRKAGSGAQWEIVNLAEGMRKAVVDVEPWTDELFIKK